MGLIFYWGRQRQTNQYKITSQGDKIYNGNKTVTAKSNNNGR